MLTGGFYHKSGLKIYFIFVIDMKSMGGRFVRSIDGSGAGVCRLSQDSPRFDEDKSEQNAA